MSEDPIPVTIPYATPETRRPSKTWAATALLFGGLGLILLGGCFLIGVLITSQGSMAPSKVFIAFLLILALACFAGAIALIILGVKALMGILRS